ncbi:MAG: hypothetical protein U0792_16825 [Gemmataceae bacterium]
MRPTFAIAALLFLPALATAQTSFPMVTYASPVAVQRGTSVEVTVTCQASSLIGAYKVLFNEGGVSAVPVPPKETPKLDPKSAVPIIPSVTLKVTVAADARLGVHEFRIAANHGISSLGQLVVVDSPVIQELPGINLPEKAQLVTFPSVVCGRIEVAENVDYYKFTAKAGQTLSFEVFCADFKTRSTTCRSTCRPAHRCVRQYW